MQFNKTNESKNIGIKLQEGEYYDYSSIGLIGNNANDDNESVSSDHQMISDLFDF